LRRKDHPNKEQATVSGTADRTKGRVKEAVGDLTDDDDLKREGKTDEMVGKAKDASQKAKDKFDEAVDSVKDKVHGD
jgi:uncharacterized protein YjbJ (UPF0337 family)